VCSNVEEDGWFIGEYLLFNAYDWSVDGVIDIGQVVLGWTLSDSTEFVVHGTVTKANPTLVSSEIGYWNTTQMSANS
jgi:hypothetical protein